MSKREVIQPRILKDFENEQTDFNEDEDPVGPGENETVDVFTKNYKEQPSYSGSKGTGGMKQFMGILDDPDSSLATVKSVSLLDITDNAIQRPAERMERPKSRRLQMVEPRELVDGVDGSVGNSSAKFGGGSRANSGIISKKSQEKTSPKDTSQKSKSNQASFDEVLAQNDEQMLKSHQSRSDNAHSQSDIGAHDLSGQNLKMDTSLDRSRGNEGHVSGIRLLSDVSAVGALGLGGGAFGGMAGGEMVTGTRDSTDTQKEEHSRAGRYDGSEGKSSNSRSHKSNKGIRPQNLLNNSAHQALLAGPGIFGAKPAGSAAAMSSNISLQNAALSNQNLAMQIELNRQRLNSMVATRNMLSQSMHQAQAPPSTGFLIQLKRQVLQLQAKVRLEVQQKLKMMKLVSALRHSGFVKDQIILQMLKAQGMSDTEASVELSDKYKKMLKEIKPRKHQFLNRNLDKQIEKVENLQKEIKKQEQEKSFSMHDITQNAIPAEGSHDPFQRSEGQEDEKRRGESDNYISPDDGLPDKQIWMYDRSQMDVTNTNNLQHNSLYFLEHQNSWMLDGLNKPLARRYVNQQPQLDRSGLNMTGLNATTTNMNGNTLLNITGMTRVNPAHGRHGDQSYVTRRFQDPPSQSRILQFEDMAPTETVLESSMAKDEEVSRLFRDQFNHSIIDVSQARNKLDRSAIVSGQRQNHLADKSTVVVGNNSFLREVGLSNDNPSSGQLRQDLRNELNQSINQSSEMIRLPPNEEESELKLSESNKSHITMRMKDITQDLTVTDGLLGNDVSNLHEIDNLNDASGLLKQSLAGTESGAQDSSFHSFTATSQSRSYRPVPIQMVDRDASMQVIEEESQTDMNDTMTENQSTPSPYGAKKKKEEEEPSHNKTQDKSGFSNTSPRSSQVNEVLNFFDKSHILGQTQIQYQARQAADSEDDGESRFLENQKRLENRREESKDGNKDKRVGLRRQTTTDARRHTFHVKPTQEQMKKLLEKRKSEKKRMNEMSDDTLQSIRERSRTIKQLSTKADQQRRQMSASVIISRRKGSDDNIKLSRSTVYAQNPDAQRWRTKFDMICSEKKNWLNEKQELRKQLKELQDRNFRLEAKVKELMETLDFADNFLQQNDISRIGPAAVGHNINNMSQITGINFDRSMILPHPNYPGGNARGSAGKTAAGVAPNQHDETILYRNSDIGDLSKSVSQIDEIRNVMAQNLRNLENQNAQFNPQQASFMMSNNNPYENSFNMTKDMVFQGGPDISAIARRPSKQSETKQQSRNRSGLVSGAQDESYFGFDVGETNQSRLNMHEPPAKNTLNDILEQQAKLAQINDNSRGRSSPNITSAPSEVKGDEDEVDLLKSATPGKKKHDHNQNSNQTMRQSQVKEKQNPINAGRLFDQEQRDSYERMVQQKFMLRDQKLDNLERKTAGFGAYQELQPQPQVQEQPRSFSALFSFFKTRVSDSVQLRNLETKLSNRQAQQVVQDQLNHDENQHIHEQSVDIRSFRNDDSVSLRAPNMQPRGTAGFGPDLLRSSVHQAQQQLNPASQSQIDTPSKDDTKSKIDVNESLRSKQTNNLRMVEESGTEQKEAHHEKRLTFNPEQFQALQPRAAASDASVSKDQQSASQVWQDKSGRDMSLDFNNIITGLNQIDGVKRDSGGAAQDRSQMQDQQSFISHIPPGQDASYMINPNSNISQNLSYANASFLVGQGANTSSISGLNAQAHSKQKTPFFADLKAKNEGISKITVPQFEIPSPQPAQEQERLTLGQVQPSEQSLQQPQDDSQLRQEEQLRRLEESQMMQLQQQYLQEQQLQQQILQQQLLQQQQAMQYQAFAGSFALGPPSFMANTASFNNPVLSAQSLGGVESDSYYMQQALLQQEMQERRRQQFQFAQMDKNQIRDQFLQMVGRGSQRVDGSPSQAQQAQQTQQRIQQPMRDSVGNLQAPPQPPNSQEPRNSAKNFFGSLINRQQKKSMQK